MLLGTLSSPAAAVQAWRTNRVCFAAGTPLPTPEGAKAIQDFRVGDRVLSRDEHDVTGAVAAKVVEEVFERYGRVMYLVVHGVRIGTTAEHPFYLPESGEWRAAGDLVVGDVLVGHDGQTVRVEAKELGEWATVYNLRIADWHTYFVGCDEWGFSVWAHNAYADFAEAAGHHRSNTGDTDIYIWGIHNATRDSASEMFHAEMINRGASESQSKAAWERVQQDAGNGVENINDALWQHTATEAVTNPEFQGRVVEGAVNLGDDGGIAIRIRASGGGESINPLDYPSIHALPAQESLTGFDPLNYGMPRAAQDTADAIGGAHRSPAPAGGKTIVTGGGIRTRGDGAVEFMSTCRNCVITIERTHLVPAPSPDTVPPVMPPGVTAKFTPPQHWGWE